MQIAASSAYNQRVLYDEDEEPPRAKAIDVPDRLADWPEPLLEALSLREMYLRLGFGDLNLLISTGNAKGMTESLQVVLRADGREFWFDVGRPRMRIEDLMEMWRIGRERWSAGFRGRLALFRRSKVFALRAELLKRLRLAGFNPARWSGA